LEGGIFFHQEGRSGGIFSFMDLCDNVWTLMRSL